jgi:hypothetical protein
LKQHVNESPKGKRRSSLDKKEGGGRGKEQRKKGKKDVITSASVFSMGPADRPMAGRTGESQWLIKLSASNIYHGTYFYNKSLRV